MSVVAPVQKIFFVTTVMVIPVDAILLRFRCKFVWLFDSAACPAGSFLVLFATEMLVDMLVDDWDFCQTIDRWQVLPNIVATEFCNIVGISKKHKGISDAQKTVNYILFIYLEARSLPDFSVVK